ncbi:hypothetical protein BDV93DRAFT_511376 [Ceratobasidium sp. AG-I]|nr:hypothetical protein BDV93DRAFT_511375 [Ceratobasidium sp. AG-I]KAF8599835.1 hypothetical protein BDV93DRAFT_511376 [Ceratobasidium sp. AG-I]
MAKPPYINRRILTRERWMVSSESSNETVTEEWRPVIEASLIFEMSSQAAKDDPKDIILRAQDRYLVGRFRAWTRQCKPHPSQRMLRLEWVAQLNKSFEESGIDRAQHPIKVLLDRDIQSLQRVRSLCQPDSQVIQWLPTDICVLVYAGQHRVAACEQLPDPQERWWFVEVHEHALENNHPAEFLAVMHTSNEVDLRLKTEDIDRLSSVHRLCQLLKDQRITKDVFDVNKDRLLGRDHEVRRGINTLTQSLELSGAIIQAMSQSQLRPKFNGATWRKLTKGRFYSVATALVQEMEQQFLILRSDDLNASPDPFALPAASCTWAGLESAVVKKKHSWNQLPGGGHSALMRVKQRPAYFVSRLNPHPEEGWSLQNMVLLPSVLTSGTITGRLEQMQQVAQHLVHIIAGPEVVDVYTSNKAHQNDQDHPAGIINQVLGDRIVRPDGSLRETSHKIIRFIWENASVLLSELNANISEKKVTDTEVAAYNGLIGQSAAWWRLLSMFKMSSFKSGLHLKIPKSFGGSVPDEDLAPSTVGPSLDILTPPPCLPRLQGSRRQATLGPTQPSLPEKALLPTTGPLSLAMHPEACDDCSAENADNLGAEKRPGKRPRTQKHTNPNDKDHEELERLARLQTDSLANVKPELYRSLIEKLCALQEVTNRLNEKEADAVSKVIDILLKLHGTESLSSLAFYIEAFVKTIQDGARDSITIGALIVQEEVAIRYIRMIGHIAGTMDPLLLRMDCWFGTGRE